MTKRKTPQPDPVVLQMASDIAQIEARMESVTQGAVAQQGSLERRMRDLEAVAMNFRTAADVYNITVNDGGSITIQTRA
jgi:hypothetical protein